MSEDISVGAGEAARPNGDNGSAGALLRRAREAAGLHVAALAVAMKVPVKKLEALEADRWDLLPDAVFVRALASSVCRTLKIDAAPILRMLPLQAVPRLDTEQRGINTPFQMDGRSSVRSVRNFVTRPTVILVALLLLAALAIVLMPELHMSGSAGTVPVEAVAVTPVPMAAEPVEPAMTAASAVPSESPLPAIAASAAMPTANANANATMTASARATAADTAPAAVVPVAAPRASAPAVARASAPAVARASAPVVSVPAVAASSAGGGGSAGGVLTLRVKSETWISVADAKQKVLIARTAASGEVIALGGALPLSVVIGRVEGVAVEVRGKPFAMEPVAGTNVARFEVK